LSSTPPSPSPFTILAFVDWEPFPRGFILGILLQIQNGTGIKEEEEKNGDNFDIEDIFPFSQQQEDDEEEEKKLQDSTVSVGLIIFVIV
jgi:hypothetical protein